MKEYLRKLFMDVDGEPSMKRHTAAAALLIGTAAGFMEFNELMYSCYGFAGACLGVTPWEKKS